MSTEVILPKVDMDMTHARLVKWHVAEGEKIVAGDILFEMETDKSVMEVEAEASGTLSKVTGVEGESIGIGEVIACILADGEEPPADAPADAPADQPAVAEPPVVTPRSGTPRSDASSKPVRATPYARTLAAELDIDLSSLAGSARRGRVQSADVVAAATGSSTGTGASTGNARRANDAEGVEIAARAAGATDLRVFGDVHCLDREPARRVPEPQDGLQKDAQDAVARPATFLLLHGFSADHTAYASLTHTLSAQGHRVLVPDLPGHGRTTVEARHPDDLAGPLDAILEAVEGGALHVVAHSLGAVPALHLSARHPVRSLTLIAPAGMSGKIHADFIRGVARPDSVAELSHLLRLLSARPDRPDILSPAAVSQLFDALSEGRLVALAEALLGNVGQNVDIIPQLQKVAARLPVRVIVGGQDRVIDARAALCLGPGIAVHHFPDAGHLPHWEYPREVLSILERAL